jgi:hypothetical protein
MFTLGNILFGIGALSSREQIGFVCWWSVHYTADLVTSQLTKIKFMGLPVTNVGFIDGEETTLY